MDMKVQDLNRTLMELGPVFAERAVHHDATDDFVAENYADLKEHRVFSALVPEEFGGGGHSIGEICAFLRGLAGYCSSTALALSMHQHLVGAALYNHMNGKPGKKVLETVASGEKVLISTGGNDWLTSLGSAEKVEGGFAVTAKKPFASGSPAGDILVTTVPYDDPEEGPRVLHFPVPFSAKGVSVGDDWQTFGMRGTGSNTVTLDKVFVPEEAVALNRPRTEYHPVWNVVITVALTMISSVYVGIADKALALVLDAAGTRPQDHTFLSQLGELNNRHTVAGMALEGMIARADDGTFSTDLVKANQVITRKTLAVEAAQETVRQAFEAYGGSSFYRRNPMERLMRDVMAGVFHPLPKRKQYLFSGQVLTGRDPVSGEAAI